MKSSTRYLGIISPDSCRATGLIDCLKTVLLERLEVTVDNILQGDKPVLIGGGTDGASVNVGIHSGMKTKMQEVIPWLSWAWCFSHRLELACKDAFTSSLFSEIDEMLLRLFYLYCNSPKKSKELDIIAGRFMSCPRKELTCTLPRHSLDWAQTSSTAADCGWIWSLYHPSYQFN